MADNIELPSGSGGATVKTDDDGTAHWQYVKLAFGADNTQTIVGSISSNPLPVALSDTDNAVLDTIDAVLDTINAKLVSGTVIGDVNLGATDNAVLGSIQTAVELIDNSVYVDDADWTALTSSHNLIGGIYQSTPGSITDGDTGPIRLDANGAIHINDGGNSITVDGTVTANPASGTIDTVTAVTDITNTIDSTISGAALTALQLIDDSIFADDAAFTLASSKVNMAGAIRDDSLTTLTAIEGDAVPLRVSSTGALHVTGGGGGTEYNEDVATPATITGTATLMERDDALTTVTPIEGDWIGLRGTAEGALWTQDFNSDSMNTALAAIQTAVELIDNAIAGSEMQVDLVSANVTNAGTFAVQVDGNALTALQLIDNPIVAHDAAASGSTGVNMIGGLATNSIEGLTQVAANDASRVTTDLNGVIVTRPHTTLEENISERITDTTGTSTNLTNFGAPGANIHNYITSATVWNSSATDGYVDLRDGSAGAVVWTLPAPTVGGCVQTFDPPLKFSANTAVAYDVSGALSTIYLSLNGFSAQG